MIFYQRFLRKIFPLLMIFLLTLTLSDCTVLFASMAPKKPVKIVVVEKPPAGNDKNGNPYDEVDEKGVSTMDETHDNYKNKKTTLGIDHLIRATSVADMVSQILGALKEDECIGSLTIAGHGSPGEIGVGDGMNSEAGKRINGDMEEWEKELEKLKDKFCPGATVTLKGCNVGACDEGAEKLQELADILGVPVEAPTGKAHPDCTYEAGSEMQRAEPSPPDSLESNDPPKCKHSPADKEKQESNASYEGPLPFNMEHLMGVEVIPIGISKPPTDDPPVFDILPGHETMTLLATGIDYSEPVTFEKRLLAKNDAVLVFHFEDGTKQKGIFSNDWDIFTFPFSPILDDPEKGMPSAYDCLSWDLELKLEEICRRAIDAIKPKPKFTLTAMPDCGYIQLLWNRVPGAERYYIYRGPGPDMEYPMPLTDFAITETSYQDRIDLVPGQLYCYYVRAVNAESREFAQSNEACAMMTCEEEIPPITEDDCKMTLKYQVDNKFYWRNDVQKGPMDAAPILREQRVSLMARYLAEEIGSLVQWEGTTRTVIITRPDGVEIRMQIGNPIATVGGVPVQIDPNNSAVVPFIEHNRTYTGLRFIAYNLGATGPDDIIWRAESRTAELIFHDPHCQWLCGSIRRLPPSPAANIEEFGFFVANQDAPDAPIRIPRDLKDSLHQLTVGEYAHQYPNQQYWCAEVRLGENNHVVAWRALAGRYPDCCGQTSHFGRLRVYIPQGAQKDTVLNIFSVNGESTKRVNEEWWVESFFDISCELPCPGRYKVVPVSPHGKFIPESHEVDIRCCPEMNEVEFDFKPN